MGNVNKQDNSLYNVLKMAILSEESMCNVKEINAEERLRLQRQAMISQMLAIANLSQGSFQELYQLHLGALNLQLQTLKLKCLETPSRSPTPASTSSRSTRSASSSPGRSARSLSPMVSRFFSPSPRLVSDTESTGSENVENPPSPKPRLAQVGKTISGRLNIHVPDDGSPTKYYINWCNRTHDNLLMDHAVMKGIFGTLEALEIGMYFKVTIDHVPEHPKEHPRGQFIVQVPAPKKAGKRARRRRRQSKKNR